jgi:dihydroorotate dehydrogenase
MQSKEFQILGVLWETADFICLNESCRHVTNGYGNYVTDLKKENERLKKLLEKVKE